VQQFRVEEGKLGVTLLTGDGLLGKMRGREDWKYGKEGPPTSQPQGWGLAGGSLNLGSTERKDLIPSTRGHCGGQVKISPKKG
jgi:hypothetical protein